MYRSTNARFCLNRYSIYNTSESTTQTFRAKKYSKSKRPSFFGNIIENIRSEYEKNPEMQENLKKFRDEARKLEESESLKEARRKFDSIEGETARGSNILREQIAGLTEKVKSGLDDISNSDAVKRASAITNKGASNALHVAQRLGDSTAFKAATSSANALKEEIEGGSLGVRVYRAPSQLRKRKELSQFQEKTHISPDEKSTGIELHKDSKFFASWKSFKEDNPVMHRLVDIRQRYEQSDNLVLRGARILSDKASDLLGGLFSTTELSKALTEITKMDPNFCKERFLKDCESYIIPNILEAMIRGDLEILEDWCYEAPFSILSAPIKQARQLGYVFDSKVLDIESLDLAMGKMMEQGPILVITFTAQQIMCVRDALEGRVVEGNPDKVAKVMYVWVLCRDQNELDPMAAWRLLELSAHSQDLFL